MREINIKECLGLFPLRIAVTDYCSLRCFFCSNEGRPLAQKNKTHIDLRSLEYLTRILYDAGLKNISITGGDPMSHPKIVEIINIFSKYHFENLFFHTNGVNLNEKIIRKLSKKFTKIAVSIHSVHYNTWRKMTGGTRQQFNKLFSNLKNLKKLSRDLTVELKLVPIKGYNDSKKEFWDFLELCNEYNFKFKILNFEPITKDQIRLAVPFKKIVETLISAGCQAGQDEKKFRGQNRYLPVKMFAYKNIRGVAIEMGCGDEKVCKECYRSNEIFVSSELKIKPCHMDEYQIDLGDLIKEKKNESILKAIEESRLFLAESPGAGIKVWQKE